MFQRLCGCGCGAEDDGITCCFPLCRTARTALGGPVPAAATAGTATAAAGAPVTDSLVPVLGPRRRHRQSCHRQCRCPGYRLPCCGPQSAAPPGPGHQRRCRCRCPPVTGSLVPVGGASSTGSISASCTGFDGCAQSLPPPCLCAPFNER